MAQNQRFSLATNSATATSYTAMPSEANATNDATSARLFPNRNSRELGLKKNVALKDELSQVF